MNEEELKTTNEVAQQPQNLKSSPLEGDAEKTLRTLANIILVLGIFISIIAVGNSKDLGVFSFIWGIATIISTLVIWSLMRVIGNISTTLKQILNKM